MQLSRVPVLYKKAPLHQSWGRPQSPLDCDTSVSMRRVVLPALTVPSAALNVTVQFLFEVWHKDMFRLWHKAECFSMERIFSPQVTVTAFQTSLTAWERHRETTSQYFAVDFPRWLWDLEIYLQLFAFVENCLVSSSQAQALCWDAEWLGSVPHPNFSLSQSKDHVLLRSAVGCQGCYLPLVPEHGMDISWLLSETRTKQASIVQGSIIEWA